MLKEIVIGVAILLSIYLIYVLLRYAKVFEGSSLSGLKKADNPVEITSSEWNSTGSMDANFGVIVWFYVTSWDENTNQKKYILSRYNSNQDEQDIEAYLNENTNDLVVKFVQNDATYSTSTIQNVPLQKWVCLGISKYNNTIDVYIDGKLADTKVGSGDAPDIEPTQSFILHGYKDSSGTVEQPFDGYTRNFKYYSRPLSPIEVYNVYKSSASGSILDSIFGSYKLKLSFLKNNEEVAGFGLG
tara:strand:+ start:2536 stop:3264 length:729 start_codon:yes stop_codon:yes gene_type:complete